MSSESPLMTVTDRLRAHLLRDCPPDASDPFLRLVFSIQTPPPRPTSQTISPRPSALSLELRTLNPTKLEESLETIDKWLKSIIDNPIEQIKDAEKLLENSLVFKEFIETSFLDNPDKKSIFENTNNLRLAAIKELSSLARIEADSKKVSEIIEVITYLEVPELTRSLIPHSALMLLRERLEIGEPQDILIFSKGGNHCGEVIQELAKSYLFEFQEKPEGAINSGTILTALIISLNNSSSEQVTYWSVSHAIKLTLECIEKFEPSLRPSIPSSGSILANYLSSWANHGIKVSRGVPTHEVCKDFVNIADKLLTLCPPDIDTVTPQIQELLQQILSQKIVAYRYKGNAESLFPDLNKLWTRLHSAFPEHICPVPARNNH